MSPIKALVYLALQTFAHADNSWALQVIIEA
jgi:hypothetical protein